MRAAFGVLIEGLIEAVWLVEPVGLRIVSVNQAALDLTGLARDDLQGRAAIEWMMDITRRLRRPPFGTSIEQKAIHDATLDGLNLFADALPVDPDVPLVWQLLLFIATGYAFKAAVAALDTIPFMLGAPRLARYLRLPPPDREPDD